MEYAYFRHSPQNDWYPHYIHNLDNLIRFGGLFPPIHAHADVRRTVLLGTIFIPEGGCMAVRARDPFFRIEDLKGKKIGLSKSLNTRKCDWYRMSEHYGIELMLKVHGMTMEDVEIVEFPYPDDWYDKPEMRAVPMNNPSELFLKRDHKQDLAFRPLEPALLAGKVDAIYTGTKQYQHLQEATGKVKVIEDLSRYPDWTFHIPYGSAPGVITCSDVMAKEHPELVVTYLKAMIKVGRWANEHKRAAAASSTARPSTSMPRTRTRASSTLTWCPAWARRASRGSRSPWTGVIATATSRTTSTWTNGPRRNSSSRRRKP